MYLLTSLLPLFKFLLLFLNLASLGSPWGHHSLVISQWLVRIFSKYFKPISLPPFANGICLWRHTFKFQEVYKSALAFNSCLCRVSRSATGEWPKSFLFLGLFWACAQPCAYMKPSRFLSSTSKLLNILYSHQIFQVFLLNFGPGSCFAPTEIITSGSYDVSNFSQLLLFLVTTRDRGFSTELSSQSDQIVSTLWGWGFSREVRDQSKHHHALKMMLSTELHEVHLLCWFWGFCGVWLLCQGAEEHGNGGDYIQYFFLHKEFSVCSLSSISRVL